MFRRWTHWLLTCWLLSIVLLNEQSFCGGLSPVIKKLAGDEGWVFDLAKALAPQTKAEVNKIIAELERTTGAELVIIVTDQLVVKTAGDLPISLYTEWGVGKNGSITGILVLVMVPDRSVVIVSVDSFVSPPVRQDVIDNVITPEMKNKNIDRGVLNGAKKLVQKMKLFFNKDAQNLEIEDVPASVKQFVHEDKPQDIEQYRGYFEFIPFIGVGLAILGFGLIIVRSNTPILLEPMKKTTITRSSPPTKIHDSFNYTGSALLNYFILGALGINLFCIRVFLPNTILIKYLNILFVAVPFMAIMFGLVVRDVVFHLFGRGLLRTLQPIYCSTCSSLMINLPFASGKEKREIPTERSLQDSEQEINTEMWVCENCPEKANYHIICEEGTQGPTKKITSKSPKTSTLASSVPSNAVFVPPFGRSRQYRCSIYSELKHRPLACSKCKSLLLPVIDSPVGSSKEVTSNTSEQKLFHGIYKITKEESTALELENISFSLWICPSCFQTDDPQSPPRSNRFHLMVLAQPFLLECPNCKELTLQKDELVPNLYHCRCCDDSFDYQNY